MFDREKISLGITPTGWTNDDFPLLGHEISFGQVVSEMALAGYEGCSVGHNFPKDRAVLKQELARRGLRVSEPWVSTLFTVERMAERTVRNFREQMEFIKDMGGTDIVVAELGRAVHQQPVTPLPNKPILTDAEWEVLVAGLHRLGRIAADAGMRLCYHHHMGTCVQTRAEVDRLMAATDPTLVHLLLDTGHLFWSGDDPLAMARAHAKRIKHVHLKDVRPDVIARCTAADLSFQESIMEGVFTVPGDGAIDFRPILQALADAGFEGWLVVEAEQDPARANPLDHARKARSYLRGILGF